MDEGEGIDRLLNEQPFFSGFPAGLMATLASCARSENFGAGDLICREGEAANRFFLIRHGQVAVEIGVPGKGRLTLQTLDSGDVLGWSWLMAPYKWSFGARALTLVRAIGFDATQLRRTFENDHELGFRVMERFMPVMGARLTAARLQLQDLYAPPGKATAL
jgi:CRP-like cAMP-binding protein